LQIVLLVHLAVKSFRCCNQLCQLLPNQSSFIRSSNCVLRKRAIKCNNVYLYFSAFAGVLQVDRELGANKKTFG